MNTALLKQKIKEDLLSTKEFIDYKWIASEKGIIKISDNHFDLISFEIWQSYISESRELAIAVYPNIGKQFKIMHDWYLPFRAGNENKYKYDYTLYYNTEKYGFPSEYLFSKERDNFDEEYEKLKNALLYTSNQVINDFKTLKDIYLKFEFGVLVDGLISIHDFTCLDNFDDLIFNQFDWIFEFLFLIRLFCNEKFEFFKNLLFLQFKKVVDFGHPDALERYLKYDEIIESMIKYQNDNNLIPEINI